MSEVSALPPSAEPLANPLGNGAFTSRRDATTREDQLSWIVRFAELGAFYAACFDTEETIEVAPGPPPTTITRPVPLKHPFAPDIYALEANARALTASDIYNESDIWSDFYEFCVVTVKFGVLPYSFAGDSPYISVRYSGRSTGITLPNHVYHRAGGTERTTQDIVVPCFQQEFVITRHEVTNLNEELGILKPLAGMCNATAITVDGQSYAQHTLHFPEFNAELAISFGGSRKASISYPVRWRPRPTWQQVQWSDGSIADLDPLPLVAGNIGPLFGL